MGFLPRTLDVIGSLSQDEQLYLYKKTKELKQAFLDEDQETLATFKKQDPTTTVYEVFLEDSTRTKESFRNAIAFHGVQGHLFDSSHSSFNKHESYADTFNMLTGYNTTLFVVRSKLEGVCTWLTKNGEDYAARHQLPYTPLFINAGDGKHEHPTQELLDEFTFLEQNDRDTGHVHIALIGDLLHGRTIHSKVDGLRFYDKVTVDLIAPDELALPDNYIEKMRTYGYDVHIFATLDDYISAGNMANIRYFTRVQLERMGEDILKKEKELRRAITFRKEHMSSIDMDTTKFYHPLPRHKITPVLPAFLDSTPLNGREEQSRNGMFTRIILIGAMLGVPYIVDGFSGETTLSETFDDDFVHDATPDVSAPKHYTEGVNPIENGMVIDHIARGKDIIDIKHHMSKIVAILGIYGKGGEWVATSKNDTYKGLIFRPRVTLDEKQIHKLAALAPGCTLNHIENSQVTKKLRLTMPPRLYNFDQLSCTNKSCISHHDHHEHVPAEFTRYEHDCFVCTYCGKHQSYEDVWLV